MAQFGQEKVFRADVYDQIMIKHYYDLQTICFT